MPPSLPMADPVPRFGASFDDALHSRGIAPLTAGAVTTLQINVGKLCNQACHHCHVEAGPRRTEIMTAEVAERLIALLHASPAITTVDITGGAPELNPSFRRLVTAARAITPAHPERAAPSAPSAREITAARPAREITAARPARETTAARPAREITAARPAREVIDRCNLTVLFEPGQEDLPDFLAENRVHVIASLPCYGPKNVDEQRGKGVFEKSIAALQRLNQLGYGHPGTDLVLDLVYNPVGAHLPPPQARLEADYKQRLADDHGIVFNHLYTITNMPIRRFAHQLARDGKWDAYMRLLVESFNPAAVSGLMCRSQISVGHDGKLYDCDFNQMLDMQLLPGAPTIRDIDSFAALAGRRIATDGHCFGCTAGAGSSCGGALAG